MNSDIKVTIEFNKYSMDYINEMYQWTASRFKYANDHGWFRFGAGPMGSPQSELYFKTEEDRSEFIFRFL